jgi:hypothetical protein
VGLALALALALAVLLEGTPRKPARASAHHGTSPSDGWENEGTRMDGKTRGRVWSGVGVGVVWEKERREYVEER